MATRPSNISDSAPPPLDYESQVDRPRRRFFTSGGWFALSAFCAAYMLLCVLAQDPRTYDRDFWLFLGGMTLIITGFLAIGIRSLHRRAE